MPKMPHNNRMSSSAALRTNDMWSKTIGHDPYAEETSGDASADAAQEQAASIMLLAKMSNISGSEIRGNCKRCGGVGHLSFQCRNEMKTEVKSSDSSSSDSDSNVEDNDSDDDLKERKTLAILREEKDVPTSSRKRDRDAEDIPKKEKKHRHDRSEHKKVKKHKSDKKGKKSKKSTKKSAKKEKKKDKKE